MRFASRLGRVSSPARGEWDDSARSDRLKGRSSPRSVSDQLTSCQPPPWLATVTPRLVAARTPSRSITPGSKPVTSTSARSASMSNRTASAKLSSLSSASMTLKAANRNLVGP
jgi:hypothetical protein